MFIAVNWLSVWLICKHNDSYVVNVSKDAFLKNLKEDTNK